MNTRFILDAKKRQTLLLSLVAVAAAGLYVIVWRPLSVNTAQLQERVTAQRELLVWMENAVQKVRRLRGKEANGKPVTGNDGSLLSLVSAAARETGLDGYLRQMQPEGETQLTVWMDDVPFDGVLDWLQILTLTHGIVVGEAAFTRSSASGRVEVRVVLTRH